MSRRSASESAGSAWRGGSTLIVGVLSGFLLAIVVQELWPAHGDDELDHFREVLDFAHGAFVQELSDAELVDNALHGMLSNLDVYSRYYDREEAEALERETVGRYVGVGIVFRRPVTGGSVLFSLPGSPAYLAGIQVGDTILEINGRPLADMGEDELRGLLSDADIGSLETSIERRDGSRRLLHIRPDSIVDPTVRHVRMLDEERGIGYLSILSFSHQTPSEFDLAFRFMRSRGMQALVLDLRRNYGGVLDSAVAIARQFIKPTGDPKSPANVILSTEGQGKPAIYYAMESEAGYAGFPMIVLVDRDSASSSEVLAGALQDHRAATLVGSPTYGKGMVQTIRRFRERETIAKVTSSYYYSPAHRNFERTATPGRDRGLRPDVEIEIEAVQRQRIHRHLLRYSPPFEALAKIKAWAAEEHLDLLEEPPDDPQLDAALRILRGERPGPHSIRSSG